MLHIKKEGNVFGAKLRLAVVAVMAIGLVAAMTPSNAAQKAPKQIYSHLVMGLRNSCSSSLY